MRAIEPILAFCLAVLGGCTTAQPPLRPLSMPDTSERREQAAFELGRTLFEALRGPGVASLLADGPTVDAIYGSVARGRILTEQAETRRLFQGAPWGGVWSEHVYDGVCVQGGHVDAEALGLSGPTWVVDRALVVARKGSLRSAAWVTGTFVLTNRGFRTIAVARVEAPRPGHADLELAPCDVQRGL